MFDYVCSLYILDIYETFGGSMWSFSWLCHKETGSTDSVSDNPFVKPTYLRSERHTRLFSLDSQSRVAVSVRILRIGGINIASNTMNNDGKSSSFKDILAPE